MIPSTILVVLAIAGFGAAPVLAQNAEYPANDTQAGEFQDSETPEASVGEDNVAPDSAALTVVDASEFSDSDLSGGQLEEYSSWLADADSRPVYLFSADTPATVTPEEGGEENVSAEMACTGDCLEAWPPVYVELDRDAIAGPGIDQTLVGTTEHDGRAVVTYNGHPLYYFARDEGESAPQGHAVESFGGTWYLIDPSVPFPDYQ